MMYGAVDAATIYGGDYLIIADPECLPEVRCVNTVALRKILQRAWKGI